MTRWLHAHSERRLTLTHSLHARFDTAACACVTTPVPNPHVPARAIPTMLAAHPIPTGASEHASMRTEATRQRRRGKWARLGAWRARRAAPALASPRRTRSEAAPHAKSVSQESAFRAFALESCGGTAQHHAGDRGLQRVFGRRGEGGLACFLSVSEEAGCARARCKRSHTAKPGWLFARPMLVGSPRASATQGGQAAQTLEQLVSEA
eukprot:713121-Rhodomonas_salina.2